MRIHANAPLGPKGCLTMVLRLLEHGWSLTEAAEAAGVSERTCSQWIARYRCEGEPGLHDRSSAPKSIPHRTPDELVEAIAALRRLRMTGAEIASCLAMTTVAPASNTESRTASKSGSQHARRLLVEAAWHYRRPPRVGRELARRQDGQPQHVTAISWQAQRRLHRTWQRLDAQHGKRRTLVAVAVARELAGLCWAVTTAD